jgi:thiomorpholine-carboxylate dehydrogenase
MEEKRRNQRNRQHEDNDPLFIKEAVVKKLLSWNECVEAMEVALTAATRNLHTKIADESFSTQTTRTFTPVDGAGVLLTMPGFVGNYALKSVTRDVKHSTLACKLVTSFGGNSRLSPPLSNILATILMFDAQTGRVKAIIEGSQITEWRTAAVSLVSTKHLYFHANEKQQQQNKTLAICGCGAQVNNS